MIGHSETSQNLLRLASGRSVGDRMALANSLVDLLDEMEPDLSDREAALIDDILNKLIGDFETAMRRELADRLSHFELTSHEAIVALANDDIDVAKPLLMQSPALRDQDLIEIIRTRSRQHQMSIALRNMLSRAVSDALVETGDEAVIGSLLSNKNAQISDATLGYLVGESRRVDSYHEPLVLREDLGEDLAKQIYDIIAQDLRNYILQHFQLDSELLDTELTGLSADLLASTNGAEAEAAHADAPARLAEALAGAREVTPDLLVKVLRAGRISLFEALIGQLTSLAPSILQKLLYNTDGKALAGICRAMGVPKQSFIEIYLLIRRSRPDSQSSFTREVGAVVRYFDRITPANALEALAHWRGERPADTLETVEGHAS